jgi:DNA-binding NtrC family response regulator
MAKNRCPDVLMCDMLMPETDGIATAIRAVRQKTRVLLFSGHAANADAVGRARSEGYDFEFLAKPVHPTVRLRLLQS